MISTRSPVVSSPLAWLPRPPRRMASWSYAAGDTRQPRCTPSATTHSWSSIESSLLTGEMAPRCTVARAPGAGDDWGPKGLKEHVLKDPGGGAGPEGGDARLAPASASACRERASGGALLEPPACSVLRSP